MRKTFATTVDEDLQENFKQTCKEKNLKINEVLEALMTSFISGKVEVEIKTTYLVKPVNSKNK